MNNCWAASLGGCDSISREHVVSNAMFKDRILKVAGFAPAKFGTKEVGKGSLTAKVLCRSHNSLLSAVDTEAARLSWAISEIDEREVVVARFSGGLLERWLLKTQINVLAARWLKGRWCVPDRNLVELAFGRRQFPALAGMYFASETIETNGMADHFSIRPLFFGSGPEPVLGGSILSVGPIRFLLCLNEDGPRRLFEAAGSTDINGLTLEKLALRPSNIEISRLAETGERRILRLQLDW